MIDRSHNLFLDILVWSGVLGLVPFCIWLFGNLADIKNQSDPKKLIAIIALLLFGLLQPMWLIHWILLFLILNW
jgi:O-antigen ligase